jgi:tetratricopeptide (TPR) repeat protein
LTRAATATAAALGLLAAASGCRRGPRDEPVRREPIVASDPALLPVPAVPAEKQDARTRKLIGEREGALREQLDRKAERSDLAAAYGELGQAYHAFGFFELALACYENAARLDPQVFAWPYLTGRVLAELNRTAPALDAVEKALALQPTNLPARVYQGDLQRALGRFDDARASYEKALEASPDLGAAWSGLGQVAVLTGDYARAVELLEKALRAEPHARRLHYPLSVAYRKLGQAEKADRHLAQREAGEATVPDPLLDGVLELNPYNQAQRGLEALQGGRAARAVTLLRAASQAFPDNIEIRLQLGAALTFVGDPQAALAEFQEALRGQPGNPHVHYNLGTTLRVLGRDQEALTHLRRAVELHHEYPEALFNLAQTLRHLGRDAEAAEPLDELLRLDPTDHRARMTRARVLARVGRCPEAVRSLEEGLQLERDNAAAGDLLARVLAVCPGGQGGDPRRALALARKSFAGSATAEHAATVALAEAARAEWAEAAAWQRRALERLPPGASPEARRVFVEQLSAYDKRTLPENW